MARDTLDVLLVEDNPGDVRLVKEMLGAGQVHLQRIDLEGSSPERSAVHHESDLASGLERLSDTGIDVVLLDLGLPDSTGLDTLVDVVDATEFTPVIVLTGLDDRDLGIQTIQHGAHDYLVKDEVTASLLVHSIQYAIEQARQERERRRHREQLEAFNRLYRISQDVIHALITGSSREELERAVCERLVEPDAYSYAWLGDVNHATGRFAGREAAPADAAFDVGSITVDEDASVDRPEARAFRTGEVQVVADVESAPGFDCCREVLRDAGYRTMVAIPVAYGTVSYGILAIYDESRRAFVDTDPENLARLGESIGHAITAVERREALTSDAALQLTFTQPLSADELDPAATRDGRLEFDRLVHKDPDILAYGTAEGIPEDRLRAAVDRSTRFSDLRIRSAGGDGYKLEVTTNWGRHLVPALAEHGGVVAALSLADGECRFVVEAPPGHDKHQLVDLVLEHFPDATLTAQRRVDRDDPGMADVHSAFEDRLTEKQRAVLQTAYHSGYFEWPRGATGEEIADRLGVTQATFSEHFRAAERTLFEALFGTDSGDDDLPASPWGADGDEGGD